MATPETVVPLWNPFPGPQTAAYRSEADELFYGGAAGGGKTDLLLGMAALDHDRSIIFRRTFPQIRSIIERSRELYNRQNLSHAKDSYNESLHFWRLMDGRLIEFASCQYEKDKTAFQGRPHDLIAFDELPEFPESIFRFVIAWNRTTKPNQRCRIVCTGNPPTTAEGRWVIQYWAPWLDRKHPRPAVPGELRWFATVNGKDIECAGPEPFTHGKETINPRSRTFIPASLKDNPALRDTGYMAVLQGLPEPLRSQLLYGDFDAGVQDDAWQVIPTAWVEASQARWTPAPPPGPLNALGVDVSRGGKAKTVIAPRRGNWFGPLVRYQGIITSDGPKVAALILKEHSGDAVINIDVIGYGSSAYDQLKDIPGLGVNAVNNAAATDYTDKTGKFRLVNIRAASYWKLREALDPNGGENLALPPDPELLADLTAARFQPTAQGIKVEPKEDIVERIGRSPDCADAVVLAHWLGGGWSFGGGSFMPAVGQTQAPDGMERQRWHDDPVEDDVEPGGFSRPWNQRW